MAPPAPRIPSSFRGEVLHGEAAALKASAVSGPFSSRPVLYAAPRDREDLCRLVCWAAREGMPLVPRGAGTGMPGGNLGSGVVVDLGPGFRKVDPPDLVGGTIRAQAGAVAARVEEAVAGAGRRLPALPASSPWCTVGGMAANNAAGPRSFLHGAICRWITALEGVDARGAPFRVESVEADEASGQDLPDPFRSLGRAAAPDPKGGLPGWPRVRKNSSGYALDRFLPSRDPVQLLVGSEGTLVLFTAVELRHAAEPEARGLALIPAGDSGELGDLCREARRLGTSTCEFLGRRLLEMAALDRDPDLGGLAKDAYALMLLELEGSPDEVEEGLRAVAALGDARTGGAFSTTDPEAMGRLWALRHRASPTIAREAERGRVSTQFIEDSVVPPERVSDYLVGVTEILKMNRFDAVVFGHAGDGNVHVNPLVDVESPDWRERVRRTLEEVAALVADLDGTLAGEHGDGRLRAPLLSRIWPPELVGRFREVKRAFDPDGILNPGVILPVPGQDPLAHLTPRPRAFP